MDMKISPVYGDKKKEWLCEVGYTISSNFMHSVYSISYEGVEHLLPLKNKGFFLLPKHQSNYDVVLEGMLLKESIGRYANYIMKDSLPSFLEYLGGIGILKLRDLRSMLQTNDKKELKAALKNAKEKREYVKGQMAHLLRNDEIVVVHAEGARRYHELSHLRQRKPSANLFKLLQVQEKSGRNVPFVPLDIYYEDIGRLGSKISLKVGEPIITHSLESLITHLSRHITLFRE